MWKFLKYTFATFIGATLGILFIGVVGAAIVAAVIASAVSGQDTVRIEDNSVLLIDLKEPIVEREQFNPLKDLDLASMTSNHKLGLIPVLNAISDAKTDPKIRGIFLQVRSASEGLATIDEIRNALEDFKSSGKFIISYSDFQDQKAFRRLPTGCISIPKDCSNLKVCVPKCCFLPRHWRNWGLSQTLSAMANIKAP